MSDSKHEVSQTENGAPAKRSKKRACVDHCKRFWWLHLIIFCCITVLVVCLVIFVGVPNIAQSKLNAADLEVQSVNVLNAKPDSYTMEINSTITTDGTVHADIDPFEGNMTLADIDNAPAFATLQFPQTNADKHQDVNISQPLHITNLEAFNQFNIAFFQNETLRVRIAGKTKIQPAGLSRKYDVDFVKVLDLAGLNLLNGTKVTDGTVDLKANKGQPNFKGTAEIPNASHFTLDIGNATFTNFADNKNLGNLTINNLLLRPGTNTVDISAELDQLTILNIIAKRPYCENGIVPFKLLGVDVENRGQKIPYFLAALGSANQTVNIDIGSILKKTLGDSFKPTCTS
ncbi:hypothetical protein TOPH_05869 [Tolypocladium ophioglossoides CBS 100239]|uniref:Uncharacterized protein n=1 Tax=Tolypocladium ophioglossoides (strain CBS 100239) TaxID=1163406 RepID=A0A0L0N6T0_TOLOC|nr:hypothetical protein TOPH_05869 [Tolypocladium ophioglossoides CBS 100239]